MDEQIKFKITPRVVEAGKKTKVSVTGLDFPSRFYDDTEYRVTVTAADCYTYHDISNIGTRDRIYSEEIVTMPEDGVLSFEYEFTGEHLWHINIARCECEKHIIPVRQRWKVKQNKLLESVLKFDIYSLESDLYSKKPYKGDFHIHTYMSDGCESPALVAARYRQAGFDTIAITDHYTMDGSLNAIEAFGGMDTGLKLFRGEEVHHDTGRASFHVVNLNPEWSVNKLIIDDADKCEQEVAAITEGLDIENDFVRCEVAWHKWVNDKIHEAGGISIFPHPFWELRGAYNITGAVTDEVYRRGFTDVIEIIGGIDKENNRLQMQLYYEMKNKGFVYPGVTSSDSHSTLGGGLFNKVWTVVYAENEEDILNSIKCGQTASVDQMTEGDNNVYSDSVRLSRYTWFLLKNYYDRHDYYAHSVGAAMVNYALGDSEQRCLIEALEKEAKKFDQEFFCK